MSDRVRVVLVDDHEMVRQGVRALLKAETDFEVVGEAGDGLSALEMVERVKPDVLVADLTMPGLGASSSPSRRSGARPERGWSCSRMHAAEPFVLEALEQGASAYVLKDAGVAELVRAIREAVGGRRYLSPPLSDKAVARTSVSGGGEGPRRPLRAAHAAGAPGPAPRGGGPGATPRSPSGWGSASRTAETHRARVLRQARPQEPDRARPVGPAPGSRHAR